MSMALTHFSIGAIISLLIFRAIDYRSDRVGINDYLRYDIIVAIIGGLWALIPDNRVLHGGIEELFGFMLCNIFFLHCLLDELDSKDSYIVSLISFGLLLLTINLINYEIGINQKKNNNV